MNSCSLKELTNMPHLPAITKLELSDNDLKDGQLAPLKQYEVLMSLKLGANKIETIEGISDLIHCPNLIRMDLTGNPIC